MSVLCVHLGSQSASCKPVGGVCLHPWPWSSLSISWLLFPSLLFSFYLGHVFFFSLRFNECLLQLPSPCLTSFAQGLEKAGGDSSLTRFRGTSTQPRCWRTGSLARGVGVRVSPGGRVSTAGSGGPVSALRLLCSAPQAGRWLSAVYRASPGVLLFIASCFPLLGCAVPCLNRGHQPRLSAAVTSSTKKLALGGLKAFSFAIDLRGHST